ncbi:MAG: cobalamin-dependent protein [Chloroflexi bacterium]|nr:cobalamin-dependent protein [Chloroflexota bacterium]MDA1270389.1 cobalamin-dependent protein [Chloroflexota bacterium]
MRILLIATNRHDRLQSRMNAQPMPIGLAYIAGHLDHDRHEVKVLDLMFSEDHLADVEATVKEFQPQMVGMSVRNLSNHSYMNTIWALPISKEVIDRIRSVSDAVIVCGGPAFSILPSQCFEFLGADLGLSGDAGETFAALADRLEIGEPDYHDLPGLVYRKNGQTQMNEGYCTSEFAKPPRLEDLDMARYNKAGFGIGILTKLGGFYYPTNASQAQINESGWRVIRPISEVVAEVKEMKERFDMKKVFFVDNGFNLPLDHAKSLCRELIESKVDIRWNTCLAPFNCDPELIGMMKEAGCGLVIMVNRAGNPGDMGSMAEENEQLAAVCKMCEDGDLHYNIGKTFGEPGETRESVDMKLDFLRGISPAMANLRVGVSVMPGTEVAVAAEREGLINDESELVKPTFYIAGGVKDWIVDYLKEQADQNPRWNLS